MGKCNLLTSGGTWDKVSKPAMGPYNEGYKGFADGEAMWKNAQQVAQSSGKPVMSFLEIASAARTRFHEAAEAFKRGDELQG